MNTLKPVIFLVPGIALVLVSIFYFILLKKAADKKAFNRFVFTTTVLGFVLNFTWEIIQMPLYNSSSFDINHMAFCALGSVADAVMILFLYFGFAFIFKNPLWIQHLKWQRILIVILTGGIGAALSEIRHLSLGNWAYSDSMPNIPVINIGLSPVLQFMILPLIIYLLSFYSLKRMSRKK